ncbi:N-acetylglucosaminyl deacetylase, LmbE family [Haloechinothrix alba]|uniref:N-acetylglucosaminyl deacetylase, LmbE family n=1 Tax=Haloechinothrix alba TaxID=664784 RepID=A0A238X3Z6_9PSEU|nr:PIG-L deacetylase family protein [Haloechinothrix alba]SNR53410.1 N-acetylglucosaminyl deacetylase, LmbE family [Haloechinothrix alba]
MQPFSDDFLAAQRVLVIAPHADDETYGCAGTMARVKALGGEVYVVLASVADLDHYGTDGSDARTKLVTGSTRLAEFDAVMTALKVDDWDVLFTDEHTHMALDTVPRKRLVTLLESAGRLAIDTVEPTMLMIPAPSYNQDHEALYQACITATRPGAPGQKYTVPFVLSYDHFSLCWPVTETRFQPNIYIDVSEYLDVKIAALRMHASQVRDELYFGSPESVDLQTRVRGREVSVAAAEAFCLLRGVV